MQQTFIMIPLSCSKSIWAGINRPYYDEFLTSANHKMLDLGCGTGYLVSVVAHKVTATVLGLYQVLF